jgi:ATP-binding cassette subfamily C protein
MILGYFGRVEPAANLRLQCGVSRDGSKASNVVKAARHYGLVAKGFSKDTKGVRALKPPFIVFWNFNHFVVVEGFAKDRVFINDPAIGHRTLHAEEFDRSFTGVVLVMEPGPDFQKGKHGPDFRRQVLERLDGTYIAFGYCTLAGLLLVIPGLTVPALSQVFLDHILLAGRLDWFRPLIVAMIAALLIQAVVKFFQLRYLRRIRMALSLKFSSRFIWHLLRLPSMFYAQRFPGEVAGRTLLNDKVAEVLSGRLAEAAVGSVMMVFYAALMIYYDPVLAALGIGLALCNVVLLRWMSSRRVEANMRMAHEYGKAGSVAMAGLQGMETIKSAGLENGFFTRWAGYHAKAANARQSLEQSNQSLYIVPSLINSLSAALLLIAGGYRVIDGQLSIGMLVAIQTLMAGFMMPLNSLMQLGGVFQELRGDVTRLDDVLSHEAHPQGGRQEVLDRHGEIVLRLAGNVEVRNVTFGYSPLEKPLLEDFSLSIEAGQRVALVGGSGSGKTTIAKLISGEYLPWKGQVLFDGIPRPDIPREVLVNSFASVTQEVFLFEGTVRDNLTMWDSTIAEKDIAFACEDAAIHHTILELPGGYDAALREGGSNLSGGQRQRLEIARSLVNKPSVLVLDEATSALDAETEALVIERLRMRACSLIIVSHRLSTIRDCDEIIVLSGGKVVERGTHDDLWSKNGLYAELIRSGSE